MRNSDLDKATSALQKTLKKAKHNCEICGENVRPEHDAWYEDNA